MILQQIKVLYEDDYISVIDKPAGLVVNDSESQKNNITLQGWLKDGGWLSQFDSGDPELSEFISRSGIVHRLDKETSGVLIVAKTQSVFATLQSQFKRRQVEKDYLALVYGKIKDVEVGDVIVIDAPIGRNPKSPRKFAVVEGERNAVTKVKLIWNDGEYKGQEYSLVECSPKTGRTHQIRVHLAAMDHPIAGDKLYSGRKRIQRDKDIFKRHSLHARAIKFMHPETGKSMFIESAIPNDIKTVLDLVK